MAKGPWTGWSKKQIHEEMLRRAQKAKETRRNNGLKSPKIAIWAGKKENVPDGWAVINTQSVYPTVPEGTPKKWTYDVQAQTLTLQF